MDVKLSQDQKNKFDERYLEILASVGEVLDKLQDTVNSTGRLMVDIKRLRRDLFGQQEPPIRTTEN